MTRTWIKSETARRGILAVLMLAVLLASVGIAWLLDRRSAGKVREGTKIIQEIRKKGLEHYWPKKLQIDWFLIHSKGNTIGWKASARVRPVEGEIIGVDVEVVPDRFSSHEIWTLSADATAGAYHANLLLPNNKGFKTDILLSDGAVKVIQHVRGIGSIAADSPAPENYLPEGTLLPAIRQTADTRADAQFVMVFNERPNRDKTVEFGTLRLRYLGRGRARQGRTVHRVRISEIRGGGKHGIVYELDEKGKILLIQGKDRQSTAVDKEAVKKSFVDAPLYLRGLMMEALHGSGANFSPDEL